MGWALPQCKLRDGLECLERHRETLLCSCKPLLPEVFLRKPQPTEDELTADLSELHNMGWSPYRATRVGEASNPGPAGSG